MRQVYSGLDLHGDPCCWSCAMRMPHCEDSISAVCEEQLEVLCGDHVELVTQQVIIGVPAMAGNRYTPSCVVDLKNTVEVCRSGHAINILWFQHMTVTLTQAHLHTHTPCLDGNHFTSCIVCRRGTTTEELHITPYISVHRFLLCNSDNYIT